MAGVHFPPDICWIVYPAEERMRFVSFTVETLSPYKAISCENLEEAQAVYAECEDQGMNPTIYGITEHGNDYMLSAPKKTSSDPADTNRYYSILRPVMPGSYPKPEGNQVLTIKNFEEKTYVEEIGRSAWGYLDYQEPLTKDQADDYDLVRM